MALKDGDWRTQPCPPNWRLEVWAAHIARIEFMEAMGHGHLSDTDPKRNVRRFKKRLLEDDRRRIVAILRKNKVSNCEIEMQIYRDE